MRGLVVKYQPFGEVIIEEGPERHGVDIGAVLVTGEGPKVKDQKAGCYVQRLVRQEHPGPADHFSDQVQCL